MEIKGELMKSREVLAMTSGGATPCIWESHCKSYSFALDLLPIVCLLGPGNRPRPRAQKSHHPGRFYRRIDHFGVDIQGQRLLLQRLITILSK